MSLLTKDLKERIRSDTTGGLWLMSIVIRITAWIKYPANFEYRKAYVSDAWGCTKWL